MLDLLWFLIKLGLALTLFMAFLYSFSTHLITYYEMRVAEIRGLRTEPIPRLILFRNFFLEAVCDFIRFLLMPFALFTYRTRAEHSTGTPVLLVHGYMQNQMDWLWFRHQLRKQKLENIGTIYSLNLFPPFKPIANFAKQLQKKIKKIQAETGKKNIILIGHSMGGLVCSYYSEYLAEPGEIICVITLGCPFQGTHMSVLGYGKNIHEMYPKSIFLAGLSQRMQNSKTCYYSIASKTDNLITPWDSALPRIPEVQTADSFSDHTLILEDHGHLRLLLSPKIIQQITLWLSQVDSIHPK